jgi:hypothetical protein
MDRRQHERYNLPVTLSFSWRDPCGVLQRRRGLLRNISGGGVFVSTQDWPQDGASIRLNVSFRAVFPGAPLVLRAVAQVVRLESCAELEGRAGFAAAIKTFTLRQRPEVTNRP